MPNDIDGHPVHAHSGIIVDVNGTYYMFGESDKGNKTFFGVNSYSSPDLVTWKFEGVMTEATYINNVADPDGSKSYNISRVERPKVMYCNYT